MSARRPTLGTIIFVQVVFLLAVATSYAVSQQQGLRPRHYLQQAMGWTVFERIPVPRAEPLRVTALYDRSDWIRDEELAAVLERLQPRMSRIQLRPNHVEHALRTWGAQAVFSDPDVLSGEEMVDFLTNHGKYLASWGEAVDPLLEVRPTGVSIRWGASAGMSASVHHDHWLASLTEAGVRLDHPVYGVGRHGHTMFDVLQEALRDFRLDEREVEWSAMAFGFWIPPTREWIGDQGRRLSFDLLVDRLVRGDCQLGVCSGTHRLYSLMVLLRLDDEHDILSDKARQLAWNHLTDMRDRIANSQFEDGHWPSNWPAGRAAVEQPIDDDLAKRVIATGHHLEWLAIAPRELHPEEEQIKRAIRWCIDTTVSLEQEEIMGQYTFFSHIASALAMWRGTHPAEFWHTWEIRNSRQVSAPTVPD